jgi:hypothetical protein
MMFLQLLRFSYAEDGIFGHLIGPFTSSFLTLEHSYLIDGKYVPKISNGNYLCKKGIHQLKSGSAFETFEVTQVARHTGILFHIGNYLKDSEGCILIGNSISGLLGSRMITESRNAFLDFMGSVGEENYFTLVVSDLASAS